MSGKAKFSITTKKRSRNDTNTTPEPTLSTHVDVPVDVAVEEEAKQKDEAKKLLKREYNKRKVRKQRASRKALEIVEDDTPVTTDLSQHVSLVHSTSKLSRIKRQKHLQTLVADQEREVFLTDKDQQQSNKSPNNPSKLQPKKEKGKHLQSELEKALSLMHEIADEQEGLVVQKIVKEKAKIEFFNEKERLKLERKEKKKQLENMMISHLYTQRKDKKREKKDIEKDIKPDSTSNDEQDQETPLTPTVRTSKKSKSRSQK